MKGIFRAMGLAASVSMVAGCAGTDTVRYSVTSEPSGAQVEVDGVSMGTAPTEFTVDVPRRWVGLANAPGGWAYEPTISSIRILPPEDYDGDRQLVSQERQIRPDRSAKAGEASIRANLYLEPRSPTQRLEVR